MIAVGERVLVVRGALAGVEGTLIRHGARSRVVISVEIIQRAVSVDVAISDVEPIRDTWAQQESHFRVA
jgi:transcription antitermination factor NusG